MRKLSYSGGCQCGAVRYHVDGALEGAHLCHCRMCQKAVGNYFMPLASAANQAFTLTRGEPKWFHSSDPVKRGFCENCGTPLFFKTIGSPTIAVALGTLDDPSAVPPERSDGIISRVTFFGHINELPNNEIDRSDLSGGIESIRSTNHQHPDHDTDNWPEAAS
ncbi:GFA family protein [Rhizobium sp. L1K21]|uniref:GFA family protein n=1 Tax=Rhizobium sp. L1K21 TaxID=2954933 RepID=UPI002093DF84|nr:GFA family protein [Rhizobium sp. L1K21]MCO6186565.1 GFA family protein [Rhizobium sp. L1K21]